MKDLFTEAYLKIISESYGDPYSLAEVLAATDGATGGFKSAWEPKKTGSYINDVLMKIRMHVKKVNEEKAMAKVKLVKEYFKNNSSRLIDNVKNIFLSEDDIPVAQFQVGPVGFCIWTAMKAIIAKETGLAQKFKAGDKVQLVLTIIGRDKSTYKKYYNQIGTTTEFFIAESDEYPNADFKVTCGAKTGEWKIGDIVKVSGTVNSVDVNSARVSINRAKIDEVVGHDDTALYKVASDRAISDNEIVVSVDPKEIINSIKDKTDQYTENKVYDLMNSEMFFDDGSGFIPKEEYEAKFNKIVSMCPDVEQFREAVMTFYDDITKYPADEIPNTYDWLEKLTVR